MNDKSRLDAAQTETPSQWYRSPMVLLAGLILFVGAIVLVAVSVGGGDDDPVDSVAVADQPLGDQPDADTESAPAADITVPPPVFGDAGAVEIGAPIVVGDPLPTAGDDDDPAIGLAAPIVTTTSLGDGAEVTLGPGTARVIGFFAHWCPHCQRELPEVAEWLRNNQLPANSEFVAVSTSVNAERENYPPSEWFTREEWPASVIVDDAANTLLGAYGFTGFPAFIAIDASGVVVGRAGGNIGAAGVAELFANFAGAPQG